MVSTKPWPPDLILQLLIRLFASMLIGMVLVAAADSSHWLSPAQQQLLTLAIGTVSFHGAALVLIYGLLRQLGMSWEEAFGFSSPELRRALLLGLLVGVVVLPIAWSLGQLSARTLTAIHVKPIVQAPVQMLQTASSWPTKVLIGFLAIAVAPFVEELVFRGLIYPTLKQNGFPRLALWGTSLLFAVIHNNLVILLPLTFLAVVLTLLYETTNNLLAPILTHCIFNFVNFFWVVVQPPSAATLWPA